jgi:hypothetical protein
MASIPQNLGLRATIRLAAGSLVAEIVPSLGGGVARFDDFHGEQNIEVFREAQGLVVLAPGATLATEGCFRVRRIESRSNRR